jgi:hypothetical protein
MTANCPYAAPTEMLPSIHIGRVHTSDRLRA